VISPPSPPTLSTISSISLSCTVTVMGSQLWRGEHTIPYDIVHTLNYVAAQLFHLVGFMPGRCHFYTQNGQLLPPRQAIPSNVVCIYELGVLNLPDTFCLGKDNFPTADCMARLVFQEYPPFEPAKPLGQFSRK
jgi:hypothetical protein